MATGKFFNNGEHEVELVEDRKTGLLTRPGTADVQMLRDCTNDYKNVQCKDQIVLDLGANIGGFIWRAAIEGAKHIISYEPEPNNFALLEINRDILASRFPNIKMEIFNEAVYDEDGTMELVVRSGQNSTCSASITRKAQKNMLSVTVKVTAIKKILDKYQPTFIKIDVEGAEYGILREELPPYVKRLAFELHGQNQVHREEMAVLGARLKATWNMQSYQEKIIFNQPGLVTGYATR